MDIVHGKALPSKPPSLKHRGDGLSFKNLFSGQDGTPENYYFALARQGVFSSPRHRHNFDQFRYAVRGDVSLAPDMLLREGELAYHPEGVEYGPQHDPDGDRDVLVLQFGGASGQGYLSFDQLAEGQAALKENGRFEGGKYYANDDEDNNGGHPVDGFQALWEYHNGRPLVYPAPTFDKVVLMKPANFAWTTAADGVVSGPVSKKLLGTFTERGTKVQMLRIEAGGQLRIEPAHAIQLLYVLQGEGFARLVDSSSTQQQEKQAEPIEAESAIRLNPDSEAVVLLSSPSLEILQFVLPMLK